VAFRQIEENGPPFQPPHPHQNVQVSTKEGPSGGGVKGKVMHCVGL